MQTHHLIERMVFELTAVGSKTDLEAEKKAEQYHRKIIEPGLEACFHDIHTFDQHLIIDRLDIDLGIFTSGSFEKEAKKRLTDLLSIQLSQYGRDQSAKYHSNGKYESHPGEDIEKLLTLNNEDKKAKPANHSEVYYRAFTYFLDRGRFPWWFVLDHRETDNEDIEDRFGPDWIRSLSGSKKSGLKQLLLNAGAARTRLAATFDVEWTGEFLQQIGLAGKEALTLWTFILPALKIFSGILPVFGQYFWTSWILAGGKENQYLDLKHILEKTAKDNKQQLRELSSRIRKIYLNRSGSSGFSDRISLALATLDHPIEGGPEEDKKNLAVTDDHHDPMSPAKDQWQKADITEGFTFKSAIDVDEVFSEEQPQEDRASEEGAIFVQAAGLVLLHPFLSELFEKTELWDGTTWLWEKAPLRAIRLLSYLTFGDADVPEYRLLIHKILAGLELETVLYVEPALNAHELSACDELLEAVIHHWKALRSTSPDGLRESFLVRKGKLIPSDKGHQLHIEKRTEDILLSRLPWGYSMIKLPWMNSLLTVSWI